MKTPAGFMVLSPGEKDAMREAGRVVGRLLAFLRTITTVGVNTRELDEAAEAFILEQGARPAFKGIYGYKYTICASENEKVVHGIPNRRRLQEGDILGLDLGAVVDGIYADAAITVPLGRISDAAAELLRVTEESLWLGLTEARPGARVGDVGAVVQKHSEGHGFSVVREFVGHGIGDTLHLPPQVPNFGVHGDGGLLVKDMAIAIEPMINAGTYQTRTLDDKWTVITADKRLSAHFEHTILLGDKPEVLTWEQGRDYAEMAALGVDPVAMRPLGPGEVTATIGQSQGVLERERERTSNTSFRH